MIQGAFTSDDAVDAEGTAAETHYTYFPSTAVGDGSGGTTSGSTTAVVTTQGSEALLGQATPPSTGEMLHKAASLRGWALGCAGGSGLQHLTCGNKIRAHSESRLLYELVGACFQKGPRV